MAFLFVLSPHFPHITRLTCKKFFGNCRFLRSALDFLQGAILSSEKIFLATIVCNIKIFHVRQKQLQFYILDFLSGYTPSYNRATSSYSLVDISAEPYYNTLCLGAVNTNYFLKFTKHFQVLPKLSKP